MALAVTVTLAVAVDSTSSRIDAVLSLFFFRTQILFAQVLRFAVFWLLNPGQHTSQQCIRTVTFRCACRVGMLCSSAVCFSLLMLEGVFRALALRFRGRRAVH